MRTLRRKSLRPKRRLPLGSRLPKRLPSPPPTSLRLPRPTRRRSAAGGTASRASPLPGPVVNLHAAASALTEHWSPRVVAEANGQYLKVAKVHGEFVWHDHANEDEVFLVLSGRLVIQYEDGEVVLEAGDVHVVPRGVAHNPMAESEVELVLFEPAATAHTGDVETDKTRSVAEQLAS